MNRKNEDLIRSYFKALEDGIPVELFEKFFHPDVVQYEFPSRLNPNGKGRKKQELLADFERSRSIISKHEYKVKSLVSDGDRVCAETEWTGILAIPIGDLKIGDAMKANFGVFFRIAEGRILEQNNYDCIHPW
ncbi:MAG TPA: nuclear transport factor 2 family protein [Fibrobacteria bacterium]|nr:nuclear transport factor 2 family protein [Fibrobacteria bacterium]